MRSANVKGDIKTYQQLRIEEALLANRALEMAPHLGGTVITEQTQDQIIEPVDPNIAKAERLVAQADSRYEPEANQGIRAAASAEVRERHIADLRDGEDFAAMYGRKAPEPSVAPKGRLLDPELDTEWRARNMRHPRSTPPKQPNIEESKEIARQVRGRQRRVHGRVD